MINSVSANSNKEFCLFAYFDILQTLKMMHLLTQNSSWSLPLKAKKKKKLTLVSELNMD